MAQLSKPEKPLKILTIDGGGLQATSSLLILDKLLNTIARNNGVQNGNPRPSDVFDVIAGIGSGGWLALLLGRFQMDIASAYAEWYNLIDCITPNSKAEEIYMRLKQHCYYDRDRLIEQIEQLTEFYETKEHMYFEPPAGSRCKHVFVSALKTDPKDGHFEYNLFRTYYRPENAKLLEGPQDPRKYKISHAFGVTGAAKYFTPPWKEPSSHKGRLKFLDVKFPNPHNITDLALDEMWGLYGTDVAISVLVNIGPGIPNASDCKIIARRFSWGLTTANSGTRKHKSFSRASEANANLQRDLDHHNVEKEEEELRNRSTATGPIKLDRSSPVQADNSETKKTLARGATFGSEYHVTIDEKLKRKEDEIEAHIREKLRNVYPNNTPPYYRLAPEHSAPGTTKNDVSTPRLSFDATQRYLGDRRVAATMDEMGHHIPFEIPVKH